MVVFVQRLDLIILDVFSYLKDSMITFGVVDPPYVVKEPQRKDRQDFCLCSEGLNQAGEVKKCEMAIGKAVPLRGFFLMDLYLSISFIFCISELKRLHGTELPETVARLDSFFFILS